MHIIQFSILQLTFSGDFMLGGGLAGSPIPGKSEKLMLSSDDSCDCSISV